MALARLLADGRWHAGPELAAALGVSRAAVWKRIQTGRELGLEIQAVRGRGYRWRRPFQPLDAAAIEGGLSDAARTALDAIEVLDSVVSTNSYLLDRSDGRRIACFAEHQTGGRGRRGRQWVSPLGANLYLSVAWPFDPAPPVIGALSLAVGVALAEALRGLGVAVGLKWPNDLLVEGAKLGGILTEHRGEAAGGCRVVVGVGLNVAMSAEQAAGVDQAWTTLAAHMQPPPQRNVLAAALLNALVAVLAGFGDAGFTPFAQRWSRFDTCAGRDVLLDLGHEQVRGRVVGIAPDGALLVRVDGRRRRFYAGELSLRL